MRLIITGLLLISSLGFAADQTKTAKNEAPAKTAAAPIPATPTTTTQNTKYALLLASYNQLKVKLEETTAERDHWKQMALGPKIAGDEARADQQLQMEIQQAQKECGGAEKLRDLAGNCVVAPPPAKIQSQTPKK